MLNIKDLESRHRKYKIKSYLPYVIALVSLIIISILTNNILYNKDKDKDTIKTSNIKTSKKIVNNEINITQKKVPLKTEVSKVKVSKTIVKKEIVLKPSLDFMRRINTPVEVYNNEKKPTKKRTEVKKTPLKKSVVKEVVTTTVKEKKTVTEAIKIEKKHSIKIKRNRDQEDIQHVIKRFKTNNNPALSLFVAKKYYKLGDYHKSYNYALITNQLNNNIEASWIIFAKSLMKLNKKDMAINTLKKYIDDSHSPRAKILLDEIQSGKFK